MIRQKRIRTVRIRDKLRLIENLTNFGSFFFSRCTRQCTLITEADLGIRGPYRSYMDWCFLSNVILKFEYSLVIYSLRTQPEIGLRSQAKLYRTYLELEILTLCRCTQNIVPEAGKTLLLDRDLGSAIFQGH